MSSSPPLFIGVDIETLPGNKPTREELVPPKTLKKQESIDKWLDDESNIDIAHRKQSLDSLKGQIFIISFCFDRDDIITLYNENEKKLLDEFADYVLKSQNSHGINWYGHNLKGFDLPFLFHRSIKHGSKLQSVLPKSIRNNRVFDTSSMFAMDQYGKYYKLSHIADFLGIEGKYKGIDGGMVYDLYLEGKTEDLKKYCEDDVRILRDVFSRLHDEFDNLA